MGDWELAGESARALERAGMRKPDTGIILGTGLGGLVRSIRGAVAVDFSQCPHFARPTGEGHAGRVVYGTLSGRRVIAMEGRLHAYEGHSQRDVIYPVRVMKRLGVKRLVLSNAAGGLNPRFRLGDVMAVTDHINLTGDSPLAGPNDARFGPRFPDMMEPYDAALAAAAERAARGMGLELKKGVYAAVKGPNLETRAEYRLLRIAGADAVGMSTVPEVIAAVHAGIRVAAFSVITDLCWPGALEPIDVARVMRTAKKAEPVLTRLVKGLLRGL